MHGKSRFKFSVICLFKWLFSKGDKLIVFGWGGGGQATGVLYRVNIKILLHLDRVTMPYSDADAICRIGLYLSTC